jgi:hypothetical protein
VGWGWGGSIGRVGEVLQDKEVDKVFKI